MFGKLAAVAQALAAPARIEMLDLLTQGPRSVEQVAEATGLTVSNASQHLRLLLRHGVLANRRDGRHVTYALADEAVLSFYLALGRFAESHSDEARGAFEALYATRDPEPPVTPEHLVEIASSGGAVTLDVRPELEFRAAHLPGAINIPVAELPRRLAELPTRKEVIAYCRGRYCVYAYQALALIRPSGRRARRLAGGFAAWREKGLPLE
jgi:rhodanese-related sulfurtransferase